MRSKYFGLFKSSFLRFKAPKSFETHFPGHFKYTVLHLIAISFDFGFSLETAIPGPGMECESLLMVSSTLIKNAL